MDKQVNISAVAQEVYVPSSLERKRAVLMYFLVGIIISIGRSGLTEFEMYHLRQALGYRLIVIIRVLAVSILLVIPKIRIVFLPLSVVLLVYLVIFIRQCIAGLWKQKDMLKKRMFYGLGSRILDLFQN
ncbi:MAG: hypothetical protein WC004_02160 [Candidatus Absconditabacterales bacterium]